MKKTLHNVSMLDFAYPNFVYVCRRIGIDVSAENLETVLEQPLEEVANDTKFVVGDVLVWKRDTPEWVNCCVDLNTVNVTNTRAISSTFPITADYAVFEGGYSDTSYYVSYATNEYDEIIPRIKTRLLCNMKRPTHRFKRNKDEK